MGKRPNVLFLMSDEHRADVGGFGGNGIVRTPNLDAIAKKGVNFRNAYTPSPACIPARQCLASGQLPKTCDCEGWIDLKPGYMTFARLFSQYAYTAAVCGKLHHEGQDQMQGWTYRMGAWDIKVADRYIEGRKDEEFRDNIRPSGDYKWPIAKEVKRAAIGRGPYQKVDEYTVQGALNFIENYFIDPYYDREQSQRPLLLKVSLLQPHYPYFGDADKFSYYLNRVEPYLDQEVPSHPYLCRHRVSQGVDASVRELRRATAAYYSMVETIDGQYGMVMNVLEQAGQNLDDWIVIYASDHGEMLGQHGIWEKQKFYEGSVKVPLLIRFPRAVRGGAVVNENVNLCDLFATLCEFCDIPTPGGLDSRSLVPLMKGVRGGWNNETVSQYEGTFMIKQDNLKYQYYPDMPEVLFDLGRDPEESVNCIDNPEYREEVAYFRRRLAELGHGPDADPGYKNAGY